MKLLLYTLESPRGRCLLLIQQLHLVSDLTGSECAQLGMALFANQHPPAHPATIEIPEGRSTDALEATCAELGIILEGIKVGGRMAREN